jgi:hypothetical protein
MPTVPGSYGPNGGTPGTSAQKGAARNATLGTVIPRCTQAPLFPTSLLWMGPRHGSATTEYQGKQEILSGGCPRVELSTNQDRSREREPVVLKGRRGERKSFLGARRCSWQPPHSGEAWGGSDPH